MKRILVAILLAVVAQVVLADTLIGRVVAVADGDTITVLDASNTQYKIRLAGIDAPEKGQPYGRVSRQRLADTVFTKTVEVQWSKRDRYGRTVGKVISDGRDVCLMQIESGLAWHYKKYEREQPAADRKTYAEAEIRARNRNAGCGWTPTRCRPGSGGIADGRDDRSGPRTPRAGYLRTMSVGQSCSTPPFQETWLAGIGSNYAHRPMGAIGR